MITAALKEALEADIFLLFSSSSSISKSPTKFKDFVALWQQLDFSLIHYCCQEPDLRSSFMEVFLELLTAHFHRHPVQCTFALYLAYTSQPEKITSRFPIPVTVSMLKQFIDLSSHNEDIMLILKELLQEDAFLVTMKDDFQEFNAEINNSQAQVHVSREDAMLLKGASEYLEKPVLKQNFAKDNPKLEVEIERIVQD